MSSLVVHHSFCPDGAGSALAAYLKLGDDAFYKPANYGDPFPWALLDDVDDVYVLDFSFLGEELDKAALFNNGSRPVYLIDHHEKSLEMLTKKPSLHAQVLIDLDYAGAVLSWQHFYPKLKVPEMFLYLEDRDLWKWRLPASKEISSGLRELGGITDFTKWLDVFGQWQRDPQGTKNGLIGIGREVLKREQAATEMICSNAEVVRFHDMDCLCVMTKQLHSEVGQELAKRQPPMSITWHWREDKKQFKVSLRAADGSGFNVNEVAQVYGGHHPDGTPKGGGHPGAAGFSCDRLPWKDDE